MLQVTHPDLNKSKVKSLAAGAVKGGKLAVNLKSFKSVARSVLSPENREWIQRNEARKIQERK